VAVIEHNNLIHLEDTSVRAAKLNVTNRRNSENRNYSASRIPPLYPDTDF